MDNIEKILRKWYESKEKLSLLEKKIEKYKGEITREMNNKNTDKLSSGNYSVQRRRNTRSFLSKDNVPSEIWKEYSTKSNYDSFYLTKK